MSETIVKLLFKVEKWCIPEWGKSELVWTKYFLAKDKATVESQYGKLSKWYGYDRCEERIEIEQIEFEELE